MPSLRSHGLRIGTLDPGPSSSIADAGVAVGHVTVVRDEPDPPAGRGVARSGVTALVPADPAALLAEPLRAGVAVLNGAGEMTGSIQVREWGVIETPVYLTATMSVGRIYDGAVAAAVAADPRVGVEDVVIPVVGECDDSRLNDARVVQVEADDAGRALAAAGPSFARGAVGAGTGMVCFGFKGGIGTASRVSAAGAVGALVLANFGERPQLRIDGVPVGRLLGDGPADTRTPRGAASSSSPSPRRCTRRSSSASPAAPVSASPGPGRSRITAAARSSSPSRRAGTRHSTTASSTRCSRRRSTPPRRRSSTRCGRPRR